MTKETHNYLHPVVEKKDQDKGKAQLLREQERVINELRDRVRMLELELADPEPLTVNLLYELMAEGYKTSLAKARNVLP